MGKVILIYLKHGFRNSSCHTSPQSLSLLQAIDCTGEASTTTSSKRDDIVQQSSKNVPHTATQTSAELLQLVRICKPNGRKKELDEFQEVKVTEQCVYLLITANTSYCTHVGSAETNNIFKTADVEILSYETTHTTDDSVSKNCVQWAVNLKEEDFANNSMQDKAYNRC
jgi:hypothetical protein